MMNNILEQKSYQSILQYAFRLLGRRSYTESEMQKKLAARAARMHLRNEKIIEKVIQRLKELKYLDDKKILADYLEYRFKTRPQGKYLFLHIMHRRGIPFEKAAEEWEKRNIDEKDLARILLKSKKRKFQDLPQTLRKQKIAQLLARNGFSAETVWGVVEKESMLLSF